MEDHTEEERWHEELKKLDKDMAPCYDHWLERDRPFWMALEEDGKWLKLQENSDG